MPILLILGLGTALAFAFASGHPAQSGKPGGPVPPGPFPPGPLPPGNPNVPVSFPPPVVLPPPPLPGAGGTPYVVTTHDVGPSGALKVHAAPSLSAPVIGSLPHGATVMVTGPGANGMLPVALGDVRGFAAERDPTSGSVLLSPASSSAAGALWPYPPVYDALAYPPAYAALAYPAWPAWPAYGYAYGRWGGRGRDRGHHWGRR